MLLVFYTKLPSNYVLFAFAYGKLLTITNGLILILSRIRLISWKTSMQKKSYFLYSFTTHTIVKHNLDYGCKKPIILYCVIINYRLLGFWWKIKCLTWFKLVVNIGHTTLLWYTSYKVILFEQKELLIC